MSVNQTTQAHPHTEEHDHHAHSAAQERFLTLRNVFVTIAAALFLVAFLPESVIGHSAHLMRAIAYFCGALAYGSEVLVLNNVFHQKMPMKEMYMPYIFFFLYILMGFHYLHH